MTTYGSVCSGIESASVAWEPLGMKASWFSEIEPFPAAVLKHHWPHVPNLGDMTYLPFMVRNKLIEAPDVLVGGTPCQAFSVAGLRGSLTDARGGLTLTYGDLLNAIDEQRPGEECVAVWENVPGVLSTSDNAFGQLLGLLAGEYTLADILGGHALPLEPGPRPPSGKSSQYWSWNKTCRDHRAKWAKSGVIAGPRRTVAWRVLDAQYFGLAQRRKRVFVVASARKDFDPAKVLFEPESMRRDTPPSRETGEGVTNCITAGVGNADRDAQTGNLVIPVHDKATRHKGGVGSSNQEVFGQRGAYLVPTTYVLHGTQDPCVNRGLAHPIGRNNGGENCVWPANLSPTLNAHFGDKQGLEDQHINQGGPLFFPNEGRVRKLMPVEGERLQGFPDGHTDIYDKTPDGPRYKAIGNSKAVNVVRWLGARIQKELGQ